MDEKQRIGPVQALMGSKWFPLAVQILLLFGLLAAIAGGWGIDSRDPTFLKTLRNTNLANLVIWSYWWPLLIIATVFFGRIWCMVCPVEVLTSWSARLGLRLRVPRWMMSGWVMTGFYLAILFLGIHCFQIHRSPHRMALYLISLVALGVLVGLVFEKRSFCAHVCPIVPLLRLYSKMAAVAWKVIDRSVCEACKTKDCIAARNLYNWLGRSCGNSIYPPTIEQNGDCMLCTQCAKVCPHDNVTLKWRRPFADFKQPEILRSAESWFILVVSGFLIYEILTEWPTTKQILLWVPNHIKSALGITDLWYSGLVHATLIFLFLPLAVWLAAWAIDRIRGAATGFQVYLNRFAIAMVPTMAGGHVAKAVFKTSSRLAYIPYSLADPVGLKTASAIVQGELKLRAPRVVAAGWPVTTLALLALVMGLAVAAMALRATGRREGRLPAGATFAVGLHWLALTGTILLWRVF